jgi:hypothetical protein
MDIENLFIVEIRQIGNKQEIIYEISRWISNKTVNTPSTSACSITTAATFRAKRPACTTATCATQTKRS